MATFLDLEWFFFFFLDVLEAHKNNLYIIKEKSIVLIEWSYSSSIICYLLIKMVIGAH